MHFAGDDMNHILKGDEALVWPIFRYRVSFSKWTTKGSEGPFPHQRNPQRKHRDPAW